MFSSYSSTYRHHEVLRSIFQYLRLILSMHIISLWRMDANVDFTWRVCFDFYARWPDFLEAEMLAHVIKFENCFTLSIRIKGFCIVVYDVNPLIPNPTKWPNTLRQFVGKSPTNCLSVFDHFVKLALNRLRNSIILKSQWALSHFLFY